VPRHAHLLTLADPSSLITEITLSELLLPNLQIGDPVKIQIDALGQQQFSGKILRIHPELDSGTRQGRVEIELEPVPGGARAGQFVRVTLHTTAKPRLMVPFTALRRDKKGGFIFVIESGKAIRQSVVTGVTIDNQIEVLSGLSQGDLIVTKGFMGLTGQKPVTMVPENKM